MGGETRGCKSSSKCYFLSACLWGHFWRRNCTKWETHKAESFWKKPLPWLPSDCKGRHVPIRQNLCYSILPLPCLCFLLGVEVKCWNYHSNKYREFSPEATCHGTRGTFVGSTGGCALLHKFNCWWFSCHWFAVKKCVTVTFWKAQNEMLKEVLAKGESLWHSPP